ncbi:MULTISPECIES: flagellar basal body P-ring formation chaperone FlgA [unclassified Anaerobiospirillum]|uniref:flagellar basal body P-ring formation chaperone FlgA n=1 Tax=unclassified Anaerobiospirillum TaxID=2647410 RepID=UPI001FF0EA78|nr:MULTISPECIES: flagellar basal body P-ring formation chaperone FlgA [unclassified Anaerobiospirillum]MCK0534331.1 flagellar basal body P-ring formation protein FlgA [Anaerobiospirillum sp. NML120511]MCK0539600.1 flagellar basal body P-ring formation protein FlgA [Anaerobiospirillum sp. NML02-A-032]
MRHNRPVNALKMLTEKMKAGHLFAGALRGSRALVMIPALLLASVSGAHATPQEAEFLRTVAEQYILAQFEHQDYGDKKIEVRAGKLDERRSYGGRCTNYLTAELKGSEIKSTSQVKITCSQPDNQYSIFVPVKVSILTPALVASRNLTRGSVIGSSDLRTIYLNEETNLTTAVSDPNILVGSRLKRDVKEGEQIRSNSFCVVCKNDKVSIVARSHGLALKTTGLALDDGGINQSIRVRNLKSNKVVSAVVSAPAEVQVIF